MLIIVSLSLLLATPTPADEAANYAAAGEAHLERAATPGDHQLDEGVVIVDVATGRLTSGHTIIVSGNKIASISPDSRARIPAGAPGSPAGGGADRAGRRQHVVAAGAHRRRGRERRACWLPGHDPRWCGGPDEQRDADGAARGAPDRAVDHGAADPAR